MPEQDLSQLSDDQLQAKIDVLEGKPEWKVRVDDAPEISEARIHDFLRTHAQAGSDWQKTADRFHKTYPIQLYASEWKDAFARHQRALKLDEATKKYAGMEETPWSHYQRSSIPLWGTIKGEAAKVEYGRAVNRLNDVSKEPNAWDYDTVANYRKVQEEAAKRGETWAGTLGEAAANVPRLAGEFLLGGALARGAGAAVGLGSAATTLPRLSLEGAKAAAPGVLGRLALNTAAVPGMYVPQWTQNNLDSAGRDPMDLKGLPAAFGLGIVQTAIFGSLNKQAQALAGKAGLPDAGVTGFVGRRAIGGATGVLESAVADYLGGVTGLQTGYGTIQDLLDGKKGEAIKHATATALTFSAFGAIHEGLEGTPRQNRIREGREGLKGFLSALEEGRTKGLSLSTIAQQIQKAHDAMGASLDANPSLTRQEAQKVADTLPKGTTKTYGKGLAETLPEAKETPAPAQPEQPAAPVVEPKAAGLEQTDLGELRSLAKGIGIPTGGMSKKNLLDALRHSFSSDTVVADMLKQAKEPPRGPQVIRPEPPPPEPETPPAPQSEPTVSPKVGKKISVREEALDLLRAVDEGGQPTIITARMRWIAEGEGVPIARSDTPADVIAKIRKVAAPPAAPEATPSPAEAPQAPTPAPPAPAAPEAKPEPTAAVPAAERAQTAYQRLRKQGLDEDAAIKRVRGMDPSLKEWLPKGKQALVEEKPVPPTLEPLTEAERAEDLAHEENDQALAREIGKTRQEKAGPTEPGTPASQEYRDPIHKDAMDQAGLTEKQQDMLLDRKDGDDFRVIGRRYGISHETARKRIKQALKKLGAPEDLLDEEKIDNYRRLHEKAQISTGEGLKVSKGLKQTPEEIAQDRLIQEKMGPQAEGLVEGKGNGQKPAADRESQIRDRLTRQRDEMQQELDRSFPRGRPPGEQGKGYDDRLAQIREFGQALSAAERQTKPGGGQEQAGEAPALPQKTTALANEVTEIERAKAGRDALIAAARKADPDVMAEAENRLRENPSAGFDLVRQLAEKPRPTDDIENALLLHHKVQLQNEYDRAALQTIKRSREKAPAEEMIELDRRVDEIDAMLDAFDHVAKKIGTEAGRAFRWRAVLLAEDFTLAGMLRRAEAAKGKPLEKEERGKIAELQKKLEDAQDRIADLEGKGTDGKGDKPGQEARLDLTESKREFRKITEGFKEANQTVPHKVFRNTLGLFDLSRAIMTALDLSAVLRQGAMLSFSHPIKAIKAFPEMLASFKSARAADRAFDEIQQRPNSLFYKRAGLFLAEPDAPMSRQEEAFLGKLAGKLPGLAGSERAYNAFLNKMRADVFDAMTAALGKKGRVSEAEAKEIARFINIASGRGELGSLENAAVPLSRLFFSPRFLASRFQLITGQPLWKGTAATRMQVAQEYARAGIGLGIFYALMSLDDKAKFNWDSRSADFGKVVIGNTHIDPLAGLSQQAVLASRLATGQTVSTTTGKTTDLRGDKHKFGQQTVPDVMTRFVRSKLAPLPGGLVNLAAGENVVGEKVTPKSQAVEMVTPMAVKDVVLALEDQGAPRGAIAGILALLGMGSQVYEPKRPKQKANTP